MFLNFPICVIQVYLKNILKKFGVIHIILVLNLILFLLKAENNQLMNVGFWVSFVILGQPICLIIYTYHYYLREGRI